MWRWQEAVEMVRGCGDGKRLWRWQEAVEMVRGCGDGERGDSEAEEGRGGSFFGAVSPTYVPLAT